MSTPSPLTFDAIDALRSILHRRIGVLDGQVEAIRSERAALVALIAQSEPRELLLGLSSIPPKQSVRDAIADLFALKRRNMRVAEIVDTLVGDYHLSVTHEEVCHALRSSSRFVALNRGWWALAKHRVHHTVRRDTRSEAHTEATMA